MANYGTYAALSVLKTRLNITDTTDDTTLRLLLEATSRAIDGPYGANRWFYVVSQTRYYTAQYGGKLLLDDLLSVTTLKTDSDGDRTYEDTWAATDYDLEPYNEWPKWKVSATPDGDYSFPSGVAKGVEIAGLWGYGDGQSATPYTASATTATVATTTGTVITTSAATDLAIGQTWLVESEQMYATAGSSTSWTVVRGVNGTTAAIHSAKAISIYQYPDVVREACLIQASRLWRRREAPFGVVGGSEFSSSFIIARLDPDVRFLLSSVRKETV